MTKEHIRWIDIAKGIDILLVILGHELTWDEHLRYAIYSFHIPLFFVLSGITMSLGHETELPFKSFLNKNVRSLLLPYVFFSLIYIVWGAGKAIFTDQSVLNSVVVNGIYFVSGYGINVLWFLISLFWGKIILFLLINILGNTGNAKTDSDRKILLITAILFVVIITAVNAFSSVISSDSNWVYIQRIVIGIFRPFAITIFLQMGRIIQRHMVSGKNLPTYSILILSVCFLLAPVVAGILEWKVTLVLLTASPVVFCLAASLLGSSGTIGICMCIERVKLPTKIIEFFGRNSLMIMVTHEYLGLRGGGTTNIRDAIG